MKKMFILFSIPAFIAAFILFFGGLNTEEEFTMNDYINWKIEQKKNKKPSYGFPDKAMQWYYEQRAYPLGYIPENWREKALEHITKYNTDFNLESSPAALSWTQLGPGNIGGRIRSILIHPSNSSIIYIGAVSGGVWKTTSGGSNWFPLKDDMENLAVCAMVMDPTNPNIIYAGTGEGFFNYDAVRGEGIFKTTDGGNTWTQLSSTKNSNFYYVNKLMIDNTNSTLWAGTRKGLYKSVDGGNSFTAVLTASGSDVHCTDIEIAYTNPSRIYAAFGLFNQSEIQLSTNSGSSWQSVLSINGHGRVEIATSPSNPLVAYSSFMDLQTNGTGAMGVTTNGGLNWFNIAVAGPSYSGASTYTGAQAWYNNILEVDPSNANTVYAGGIDFWRSTNAGSNWAQKSNWYQQSGAPPYVHADHHAVAFDPANSNVVFLGTDGGIFKSTNRGDTWTSLNNNLFITQFYYGAVHPSSSVYYGGTQDNGTLKSTGGTNWFEILGGDGGATEVDFNNPQNIYMEYVNFAFFKSTNAGASFFKAMSGIPTGPGTWDGTTDRTLFISPFSMDPNNSNTIVGGTYRVWRTTNGASSWTAISGDLTGDGTGQNGAKISTVIVAKGNSNVIYAGCSNGRVQVTTNSGTNWTLRNSGLPNAYCTRITTNPSDPGIAYATFSGFSSGQKVYKTTNYGQSWSNISSNLPNIPVHAVVVNPANTSHLIVGTDLGVFTSTNDGGSWTKDNNGLANVVVMDLDYRSSDNKIFAATHGRSMYSASLSGGSSIVTASLVYDDGVPTSGYFWNNSGQSSVNRMTPTLSNASLMEMSIYFTGSNNGINTYIPVVLQNNGGQPGNNYVTIPGKTASTVSGWDATDLSSFNITVNGDFFVGIKYDGNGRPTFGYDPVNNGRAWDFNGSAWSQWNETYFVRATIQTTTSIVEIENSVPKDFVLYPNYPNPFNPSTTIKFALPKEEYTEVTVYDIAGKEVAKLVQNNLNSGTYTVSWNGKNNSGLTVSSGIYLCTIIAGKHSQTIKMLMMK